MKLCMYMQNATNLSKKVKSCLVIFGARCVEFSKNIKYKTKNWALPGWTDPYGIHRN